MTFKKKKLKWFVHFFGKYRQLCQPFTQEKKITNRALSRTIKRNDGKLPRLTELKRTKWRYWDDMKARKILRFYERI